MKYALIVLALVVLCTASMATPVTGPVGGWGKSTSVTATATGTYTMQGAIYDPNNGQGIWKSGTETGSDGFVVTADIEMWCSIYFAATDINFHIGQDLGDSPKVSAVIPGALNSNHGMWLFVTKKDQTPSSIDMSTLKFKNNVAGTDTPSVIPDIPVYWYLTDKAGEHDMNYSGDGNGGTLKGFSYRLDGGVNGYHDFQIRCEIRPNRWQQDGHYEMDPVLVGSPDL